MRVRSTQQRCIRRLVAAGLVLAVASLSACGTPTPSEQDLTEAFEVSGFSDEVALCASAALVDNMSDDELVLLVERGGGGAPLDDPDDDGDSADLVREALVECRALETPTTTVPIGGATDESIPDGAGSTPSGGSNP